MLAGRRTSQSPLTRAFSRIGAEMGLAQAPAVEDDLVAGLPGGMRRGFDRAGEIDAGDHREAAHHRRLAGDRKPVLVVHRRPFDATVTSPSIRSFSSKSVSADGLAVFRLVDHDRLECRQRQLASPTMVRTFRQVERIRPVAHRPRDRLLDDRQVDQRRQHAEQDRQPPDRRVGAECGRTRCRRARRQGSRRPDG